MLDSRSSKICGEQILVVIPYVHEKYAIAKNTELRNVIFHEALKTFKLNYKSATISNAPLFPHLLLGEKKKERRGTKLQLYNVDNVRTLLSHTDIDIHI